MKALEQREDQGSMLIVALGILTLLAALALTFVSLMELERKASKNYVDGVRARLIAEGGLERAMAQLQFSVSGDSFSDPAAPWIYADGRYSLLLEDASLVESSNSSMNSHRSMIRGNNSQGATVNVFGIAASGSYRAFCQGVARDNGGAYVDVP